MNTNQQALLGLILLGVLIGCVMIFESGYHRIIERANRWVVYYGAAEPAESFLPYDVIVFDAVAHPPLGLLKAKKRLLLGYISYGEEGTYHPLPVHSEAGVRLQKDTRWGAENYVLDLRSEAWRDDLLQRQIPAILKAGFDGIMIDTIDMPLEAVQMDAAMHQEMQQAAVALVKATRKAYPDMPIMLNRGFEILPEVANDIDMLLGESITTFYDAGAQQYSLRSEQDKLYVETWLKRAWKRNPELRVFSLNYWPQDKASALQQVYRRERQQGHVPYVALPDLQKHFTEPQFTARK